MSENSCIPPTVPLISAKITFIILISFDRIGILKGQLDHYKDIISQRCPKDMPVITYQDNLQMQRSSLRHLRLSKLEKEKYKQEKLWDFTMRGWRKANVDGIEDLFLKKETAVKPQGDVSTLQYADTLIGRFHFLPIAGSLPDQHSTTVQWIRLFQPHKMCAIDKTLQKYINLHFAVQFGCNWPHT